MTVRSLRQQPYDASISIEALAPVRENGFFSGTDGDEDSGATAPPSGDSHYEISAVLDDGYDDSDDEIPVLTAGSSAENAGLVASNFESGSTEIFLPSPWYYKFIDSWGRFQFFTAIGFAAASLSVLGFLLARTIVGGQILSSSTTALILGCVGTIAFLLLSLSATALIVLLVDLARNVRRLIEQAERNPATPGDQPGQNHPKLSHPLA